MRKITNVIICYFLFIYLFLCVCVSFDVCVYVFRSELIRRMETTRECMGPMPTSGLVGCCLDNTQPPTQPKRVVMETGRDIYIGSRTRAPELFNRSAIERDGRRVEESNLGRQQSAQLRVGPTEKLHCDSSHFFFLSPLFCVRVSLFLSLARLHYDCVSTANIQQPAKSQQQQQSRDQPSWKIKKKKEEMNSRCGTCVCVSIETRV
jgi:hypothetical protein